MPACAGTYASSKCVYTQADCEYLEWHGGPRPSLMMRGVNHSTPTRAGGSVLGTVAMGAASIITAKMGMGVIR